MNLSLSKVEHFTTSINRNINHIIESVCVLSVFQEKEAYDNGHNDNINQSDMTSFSKYY